MQIEQVVRNGLSGIIVYQWGRKPVEDWNFHPYFYIPEYMPNPQNTIGELGYKGVDGVPLRKITCRESKEVHELRGDVHYEADSPYTSKYWVDKVITWEESKPRVCAIDIEAASDGTPLTSAMIENAPDAIIILGVQLDNGKVIQFCWNDKFDIEVITTKKRDIRKFKTEVQMANAFVRCLTMFKPEIITGFNILGYDIPYIINRFTKIGVDLSSISPQGSVGVGYTTPYIKGVALFDYFLGYTNIKKRKFIGNKLDDVLKRELGLQKYKGVDSSQLKKAWRINPDEVLEYNFHDVDRMMQLDRKLEILDTHIMFHSVYGCNLSDTLYPGKMLENYMSRRLPFIYPSTRREKGTLKGAEPKPPLKGVHKNVLFMDLTSAYPTSMVSCNMSVETEIDIETYDGNIDDLIDVNGVYFLQPEVKKGAYVKIIEELFEKKDYWSSERDKCVFKSLEWKNANSKRTAFKVGINTIYGLTGDIHSKFYNINIANSVTAVARGVIKFTTSEVVKAGHTYIFGHTDSIGFQTKHKSLQSMIDAGNELRNKLNEQFPLYLRSFNVKYENAMMNIDFERIAKIGIFSGKTRYAIKILYADGEKVKDTKDNSDIELKGWDAIRSDSSIMAKKLQKQLIIDILNEKDRKELEPYYQKELKKIRNGEYPVHMIGVPAEFKKRFKEYPKSYYRVVGAEWSNEHLGTAFDIGSKPFFIGASAPSKFNCPNNVAVAEETVIPAWLHIDYEGAMLKTQKKLGYVYSCLSWDVNSLLGQKTIFEFGDNDENL